MWQLGLAFGFVVLAYRISLRRGLPDSGRQVLVH